MLADGQVAFDEYERAVLAAVDCMRREGFTVEVGRYPDTPVLIGEPGIDPSMLITWGAVNAGDAGHWEQVAGRCRAQWSELVERVWRLQIEPSEQQIQAWLDRAWQCAEEKGLPLTEPPTIDQALASIGHGCRPWETES